MARTALSGLTVHTTIRQMSRLPENADGRVRRYFEYYERRLQGQSDDEIATALGFKSRFHLYEALRSDGFPVCEICGESPAPIYHCIERSQVLRINAPSLPEMARQRLGELIDIGLQSPNRHMGTTLKQGEPRNVWDQTGSLAQRMAGDVLPVLLKDGREAWLRPRASSEKERSYPGARLFVEPLLTDRAILAALTILEAMPVEPDRFWKAWRIREALGDRWLALDQIPMKGIARSFQEVTLGSEQTAEDQIRMKRIMEKFEELKESDPQLKDAETADLLTAMGLEYPAALLRHYHEDFDDLPEKERIDLLRQLCRHIKKLLDAARDVQRVLEYGRPGGLPPNSVKDAERDLRAAELKDALGLSNFEVGQVLHVPLDQNYYEQRRSNKQAENMAVRGRKLWKQVLGEMGYKKHLETVRPRLKRWCSLSEHQRHRELIQEAIEALDF